MPYGVFVIGLGRRARSHVQAVQRLSNYVLLGGYDINKTSGLQCGKNSIPIFDDIDKGLSTTRPDIVVLTTPPAFRLQPLQQVLQIHMPKILLVEKPLALNYEEGKAIVSLCQKNGVKIIVTHQLPYSTEFNSLLSWVNADEVGDIRVIKASCFGSVFDQGSHLADLSLRILDKGQWLGRIEAFVCDDLRILGNFTNIPPDYKHDVSHSGHDWINAQWITPNGTEVLFRCGLLAPVSMPSLGPWLQKKIEVIGTKGIAEAHVAAYAKLIRPGQKTIQVSNDIQNYELALDRLYASLETELENEAEISIRTKRDLANVALLEGIHKSAETHSPISVSSMMEKELDNETESSNAKGPKVSVIMPMEDHRGMGLDAVRGWAQCQDCASDEFELIIILDSQHVCLQEDIHKLLRPNDQLKILEAPNEMAQYDAGARMAKGDILLFTEPHCIPEPQAISETIIYFDTHSEDGFCCRSTPIVANKIASMESQMYDDGFLEWSKPDRWEKVILRGVALKRKVYLAVGGFSYRYDRFAEWLLAAELKRRGYKIGYAPGVGVAHLYSDNFLLLDRFIQEFTDGESLYRLECDDPNFCRQFFNVPYEWDEVIKFSENSDRALFRKFLGVLSSPVKWVRIPKALIREIFIYLPAKLFGARWLQLRYALPAWKSKVLASNPFATKKNRYKHFIAYWVLTTALCRVRFLVQRQKVLKSNNSM